MSDFHKSVQSVFKTTFPKPKPKEITYTNFKNFSEEKFNQELGANLGEKCVKNYASFENVFLDTLNKHALLKKKSNKSKSCPISKEILKKSDNEKVQFTKDLF